ncbi:MAG: hypothetical protein J6U54_10550 [Clostridiales bacterium]|nr:hypothetical protein [Clostridiales bacterium]
MAVLQGLCKNCGSLVVYNSADEMCDCIFCNAVFPIGEVIPVDAELKDIVFPNIKYEKQAGGKNQYSTMPDRVTPIVNRNATSTSDEGSVIKQFELEPKDVKAPKKVIITLASIAAAVCIVIASISVPLYFSRTKLLSAMENKMPAVVSDVATVDTAKDSQGRTAGYFIFGLKCQNVRLVTSDDITEDQAKELFDNYCAARKEVSSKYGNKDVEMKIYADKGIYTVTANNVEFTKNSESTSKK